MDLSVIIPVYNTPRENLIRCFSSIKMSEGIRCEVLIVDDGSGEETGEYCREYACAHKGFRYVFQENQGVSAARNTGMEHARGTYIMFLDSDDELIPDSVDESFLRRNWDMVFFDFEMYREGHCLQWKLFDRKDRGELSRKDFFTAACHNRVNTVWAKLFRRELLMERQIRFDCSMVVAEDAKFVLSAILESERLCYGEASVYRYSYSNDNGNRRLRRYPVKILENSLDFYRIRKKAVEDHGAALGLNDGESAALNTVVRGQIVNDLFEAVGSLLMMGIRCEEMDPVIVDLMEELEASFGERFSPKIRIKLFLLKNRWDPAIRICARLRLVYLKLRG